MAVYDYPTIQALEEAGADDLTMFQYFRLQESLPCWMVDHPVPGVGDEDYASRIL